MQENSLQKLSHLTQEGDVYMVDVSDKKVTVRSAIASGQVLMSLDTLREIEAGNAPKGDVIATAKIAGIMAAKQTSNLIPLCHPLPLQQIEIEITADEDLCGYHIKAKVKTKGKTGVEMEALTAVSVTALTLYDMAKALQKSITIESIQLVSKTGGKSDYQRNIL